MVLEDVDWINLAADKHRRPDFVKDLLILQNAGSFCAG